MPQFINVIHKLILGRTSNYYVHYLFEISYKNEQFHKYFNTRVVVKPPLMVMKSLHSYRVYKISQAHRSKYAVFFQTWGGAVDRIVLFPLRLSVLTRVVHWKQRSWSWGWKQGSESKIHLLPIRVSERNLVRGGSTPCKRGSREVQVEIWGPSPARSHGRHPTSGALESPFSQPSEDREGRREPLGKIPGGGFSALRQFFLLSVLWSQRPRFTFGAQTWG